MKPYILIVPLLFICLTHSVAQNKSTVDYRKLIFNKNSFGLHTGFVTPFFHKNNEFGEINLNIKRTVNQRLGLDYNVNLTEEFTLNGEFSFDIRSLIINFAGDGYHFGFNDRLYFADTIIFASLNMNLNAKYRFWLGNKFAIGALSGVGTNYFSLSSYGSIGLHDSCSIFLMNLKFLQKNTAMNLNFGVFSAILFKNYNLLELTLMYSKGLKRQIDVNYSFLNSKNQKIGGGNFFSNNSHFLIKVSYTFSGLKRAIRKFKRFKKDMHKKKDFELG